MSPGVVVRPAYKYNDFVLTTLGVFSSMRRVCKVRVCGPCVGVLGAGLLRHTVSYGVSGGIGVGVLRRGVFSFGFSRVGGGVSAYDRVLVLKGPP